MLYIYFYVGLLGSENKLMGPYHHIKCELNTITGIAIDGTTRTETTIAKQNNDGEWIAGQGRYEMWEIGTGSFR